MSESNTTLPFSVLMAVYYKDPLEEVELALKSITEQSLPPNEIVLVKDGPLGEALNTLIEKWRIAHPGLFQIVQMEKNVGLTLALQIGIKKCSHDLVARMDSDDYSAPDRFRKQIGYYRDHPETDLVCSWAGMFHEQPGNIVFVRTTPPTHEKIARTARFRNPLYHGSCMYRRSAVLSAGNYQAVPRPEDSLEKKMFLKERKLVSLPELEDYYLWARMIMSDAKMACIPEPLYMVRWDDNLIERRSGFKYALRHASLQKVFLKIGFISFPVFVRNLAIRFGTALIPERLLRLIRKKARL